MGASLNPTSPPWSQRWVWSPAFQGSTAIIAIILLSLIVLLAIGCLIMRRGSGPATHAERVAARSKQRWISTISALLFPPLLALGAWMVVFPGAKPVRLYLVSRVLHPDDFQAEVWQKKVSLSDEAARSTVPVDVGPVVDEALAGLDKHERLAAIPSREEMLAGGDAATAARDVLLEVLQHSGDLNALRPKNARPEDLVPQARVSRWPAWFVESVELACLRLLAQRANVHEVFIADSGRVDRFGQSTYDDAQGYLAGTGSLTTASVHVVHSSKSHNDVVLLSATRWQDHQLLLRFQVPAGSRPPVNVDVFAPADASRPVASFPFTFGDRPQFVPKLIKLPATPTLERIRARTSNGVVSQVEMPPEPGPVEVVVPSDLMPTATGNPTDRSYYHRTLEDLAQSKVSFSSAITSTRSVLWEKTPDGVWLHHQGAEFDRATKPPGTNTALRELQLGEVAVPSLLSLDRHQESSAEPVVPQAGGFVLGWAPAYRMPASNLKAVTALQFGEVMQEPASIPLAVVLPDAKKPMESVIWLGVSPPPNGDRSMRAAAYWWTVGNLARRCAYPANLSAAVVNASPASTDLRPVNLLDDSLISQVSVLAHAAGSAVLGVALLFASCASLAFIASANRRRAT